MMDFSEQQQKDFRFLPSPVVETRWREKTFSPEVSFYGAHYIVGSPQSTREAAEKIAADKAALVKEAMLAAALGIIGAFPKARG